MMENNEINTKSNTRSNTRSVADSNNLFWIYDPTILYEKYLEFVPMPKMERVDQLNALTRFSIYFLILAIIMQKSIIWIQIPILFIFFLVVLYFIFKSDKEGLEVEIYRKRGIDINAMGDEEYPENRDEQQEPIIIESGYYDSDNKLHVSKYLKSHAKPHKPKLKINMNDRTKYEKNICRKPTKDNPFMNPLLNDITIGVEESPIACNADDDEIKNKIVDCYNEDLYRDVGDLFERHNSQRQFYTVPQLYPNDQKSFADWCYKSDNICKVDQGSCLKYEDLRFKRQSQVNY